MTFCAGHRLYNPNFSDENNLQIFGACSNPNGHGHNYVLEVTVTGSINSETGMIINLKEMKNIIETKIISRVDHKNLNLDVDFMSGIIPTTENFAQKIWEILDKAFGNNLLDRIVIWESENNKIEISR
ncbi:MAG: 6-pyruvoyl tetrahydrobiopterin synthase [candidate division Zixibacteria bacterium HGW-Zixibacteria-1]|nr:MAG: 6-pyruvoyl tetrahydrobiopterin synthase [candidate division Zixibacteria bacterium HGW-Zixibacteria-1]